LASAAALMSRVFLAVRALAYSTGFVGVWVWLALQVERRAGGALPALPAAGRIPGVVLIGLGGTVVLTCVAMFVVAGRGTPAPFDPPRALVPRGPYRWVRNPMYLGALLVLVGFGLWRTSLAMILLAVPAALCAHLLVVLYEEPSLQRRFGSQYLDYQRRVQRWSITLGRRPAAGP
jgi:protein-S-isoprenylcysteine O-methyltransferase Ste14